jgi:hypothetical protein
MKSRVLMMITAVFVGLSAGWLLPAQQAPAATGPQWKDTKEWEEAQEIAKGKTDAERLAAVDRWSKDYPNTEVWQAREESYFQIYAGMKDYRKLFDRAKAIHAKEPNYFHGISTILSYVRVLNPVQPADLATAEETAQYVLNNDAKVFDPANKPISMDAAQWPALKAPVVKLAQQTIAWVAFTRKDYPKAETELTKVVKEDNTQAQYSYWLGSTLMAVRATEPQKIPAGIYHIARAATYDGQNALPATSRQQALTSVTSIYTQYHGSADGLQPILTMAKNNAFPPADFKIKSVSEIAMEKFKDEEAWEKANPDLAMWKNVIREPLMAPNGEMLFEMSFKGTGIPGGVNGVETFKAKIISMTPETAPKEMVVSVFDGNTADAKLLLDPPLPGTMPVGSEIRFKGAPAAYTKSPFMVTFDVDTEKMDVQGWTGTGPKANKAPPKSNTKGKKGK